MYLGEEHVFAVSVTWNTEIHCVAKYRVS